MLTLSEFLKAPTILGRAMGKCRYCGKPAGFLRSTHKECQIEQLEKAKTVKLEIRQKEIAKEDAIKKVRSDILNIWLLGNDLDTTKKGVQDLASKFDISDSDFKSICVICFEGAVNSALSDDLLSEEEEAGLLNYMKAFSLNQDDLDYNGYYTKVIQAAVLRDVMNGAIPSRVKFDADLPFNFTNKESCLWVFQDVDYFEEQSRRHYEGGSVGGSIRVAKGLYLRASSFKGHPVDTVETNQVDTGLLAITNQHVYFAGTSKSFRVKFDKIVSFKPFDDGFGIQKDAQSARPQTFVTDFGWFSYNLVRNAALATASNV